MFSQRGKSHEIWMKCCQNRYETWRLGNIRKDLCNMDPNFISRIKIKHRSGSSGDLQLSAFSFILAAMHMNVINKHDKSDGKHLSSLNHMNKKKKKTKPTVHRE